MSNLAAVNLRAELLILLGFALQLMPSWLPALLDTGNLGQLTQLAWLAGALLLVAASLLNWTRWGFRLVALGVLTNAAAITANGGMPVGVAALEYLGIYEPVDQLAALTPLYHLSDGATRLPVLGDVLPVPGPAIVQSVVSIGDLFLMVGVSVLLLEMTGAVRRYSQASP